MGERASSQALSPKGGKMADKSWARGKEANRGPIPNLDVEPSFEEEDTNAPPLKSDDTPFRVPDTNEDTQGNAGWTAASKGTEAAGTPVPNIPEPAISVPKSANPFPGGGWT